MVYTRVLQLYRVLEHGVLILVCVCTAVLAYSRVAGTDTAVLLLQIKAHKYVPLYKFVKFWIFEKFLDHLPRMLQIRSQNKKG